MYPEKIDFNACMGVSSQNNMVCCSLPFYKQDVSSNYKTITKTNYDKTKFMISYALEKLNKYLILSDIQVCFSMKQ